MADELKRYGDPVEKNTALKRYGDPVEKNTTLKRAYGGEDPSPLRKQGMNFSHGGMVKMGSPKVSAPCKDTKTIKCS